MSVEQQEKGSEKGQAGALSGKTFGGYRLGDALGGGAVSQVYVAEPAAGGEKVVLRIFATDLSRDKNLAARLVADLQKACAVTHPSLVPVREVGIADYKNKRQLYVVTARLEGESLKSRLSQKPGPLPLPKALHIASEVGAALQAIHRANGTHRQINAGAVFLSRGTEGEAEKVYLLDLGNALVPSDGANDKSAASSKSGQGANKSGKTQDDIRGLALLVQEMLGGVDNAANGQPLLPLRAKNPKVPARLDAVLRNALGDSLGPADRASRFDSVAGFVAALFGTGETQPAFCAWSEDGRTLPHPRSKTSRGLLLGAGAVAVLIGAIVSYWLYAQDTPPSLATPDLATVAPMPKPMAETSKLPTPSTPPALANAPATAPTSATLPDGGTRAHVGPWPKRTGTIPPLRDADTAPSTSASAPPATGVTPPVVRAPAAAPAGAAPGASPAPGAAPAVVRAPAVTPAGGATTGPQSAPAAPKTQPAAKPPAPPQGPGATSPAPLPGPSGQKEVK